MGWDRWIGRDGAFVGMTSFGASGPYEALYKHFGITRGPCRRGLRGSGFERRNST